MIKIGGKRVGMKELAPDQRIQNFDSVPCGYTEDEVVTEARRCLQCLHFPCELDCPIRMDIRGMIRAIAFRDFKEAFLIAKKDNPIPGITGRVCPQEEQCEGVCPFSSRGEGVNIGKLEAFVADWALENKITEHFQIKERPEKVGIVGSGPAGISCAVDLRKRGYQVSMFEALHLAGGVLQYGIPAFRLPKEIVDYEISYLEELRVELNLNTIIGQNLSFDELLEAYQAVFIGTGAGAPQFLNIDGERLKGVYSANEFLFRTNLMKAYLFPDYDTPIICGRRVGVIGAGNVAMDVARCAIRLGSQQVFILYRRTRNESPARIEEIHHALEEGVEFIELVNPIRILGDNQGWVTGVELSRMKLGAPDKSGRPRPVKIEDSEFIIDLDTFVEALGTRPNRLFLDNAPQLSVTEWGTINVNDDLATSIPGVYAGGDATRGNATVILALGDGRKAAESIHRYISRSVRG